MALLFKDALSPIDLAWAAGLFDGEGWVTVRRDATIVEVGISMTDVRPIEKIRTMFGGSKCPKHDRRTPRHSIFSWQVTSSRANRFLCAIRPYLVLKSEVADLGMEVAALTGQQGRIGLNPITLKRRRILGHAIKCLNDWPCQRVCKS